MAKGGLRAVLPAAAGVGTHAILNRGRDCGGDYCPLTCRVGYPRRKPDAGSLREPRPTGPDFRAIPDRAQSMISRARSDRCGLLLRAGRP